MEKKYFEVTHKDNQQLTEEDVRIALAIYYPLDQFEVKELSEKLCSCKKSLPIIKRKKVIADGTQGMTRGE